MTRMPPAPAAPRVWTERRRAATRRTRTILAGAVLPLVLAVSALGQGPQVHGESSSFAGHGVAMAWGILRGSSEETTQVVLRIARAGGDYAAIGVDGVDPFTQRRQTLVAARPLGASVDIRTSRATFADLPRREIHFYRADASAPSLTVYFLGLPDTTPEFGSEAALEAYLQQTLATLRGR